MPLRNALSAGHQGRCLRPLPDVKMTYQDIKLKEVSGRNIVYLKCKGPWRRLPDMVAELDEYMATKGLKAKGPPSGIFYNTPSEVAVNDLEWDVFYSIPFEVFPYMEQESGFGVKKVPSVNVATFTHTGSLRSAGKTYAMLEEWIKENGFKVCGPAEEVYLSEIAKNEQIQEIEIRLPVSCITKECAQEDK